jgi:hypothetical protein
VPPPISLGQGRDFYAAPTEKENGLKTSFLLGFGS